MKKKGALSDEKQDVLHLTMSAGIKALVDFALAEDYNSGGGNVMPPSLVALRTAMPTMVPAVFMCFERLHRKDCNRYTTRETRHKDTRDKKTKRQKDKQTKRQKDKKTKTKLTINPNP